MKIIFMPMLPLTQRDYEQLGIKYFYEKNYEVTIIESHQLLMPHYKESVDIEYFNYQNTYEPSTEDELLSTINNYTKNDYIFFYLASKEAVILLNKMKKFTNAKFVTYISGSVPYTSSPCGILNIAKSILRPVVKKLISKKFDSDIVFTGSPKDELIFPFLFGKNTKVIHTHSRDYELCLNVDGYNHDKEYCVFLDTDVIDASDYVIFGNKSDGNTDNYYKKLIDFFEFLQDTMKIDVLISAHPKSRIFKNTKNFKGFKVVHNSSPSLVKNSKFVISEGTTAISFAVYFDKPMIFFTMEELRFFYKYTCSYAKQFKKNIFQIDDLQILDIDTIKNELNNTNEYDIFKYNYLTYKDESRSVFEKIERELLIGR